MPVNLPPRTPTYSGPLKCARKAKRITLTGQQTIWPMVCVYLFIYFGKGISDAHVFLSWSLAGRAIDCSGFGRDRILRGFIEPPQAALSKHSHGSNQRCVFCDPDKEHVSCTSLPNPRTTTTGTSCRLSLISNEAHSVFLSVGKEILQNLK